MAAERRRGSSIRARTTAAACLVVATALVIGVIVLLGVLHRALVSDLDDALRARATEIAALVTADDVPATLALSSEDAFVQVVDASGDVVAASANLSGHGPALALQVAEGPAVTQTVRGVLEGEPKDVFRLAALAADGTAGRFTVYVGTNLDRVDESVATVRRILVASLPVVVALVGTVSWRIVGRALRPVDDISREVADIGARDLGRRVPEPGSDDEIGHLARTMNAMLDRLQSATERQRRFVADASHELQSPLASSRADLDVALAHPDDTDWPGTANALVADNERMTRLVRDLLFLARADDGTARVPRAPVDLDDVVLAEVARLRSRTSLALDVSRVSPVEVRASSDQLARVVSNLLENAARHARERITLELAASGDGATLAVADDGPGVPPEERERIFERFARSDSSRSRDTGGAGLGLAIAREIVEAHGGRITLEPSAAGARFVVRLPLPG